MTHHSLELTTLTRNEQQTDSHQTRSILQLRQEIKAKHMLTVLV